MPKFDVRTAFPVAVDSRDHTHPGGTANDSSINLAFDKKLFALFPGKTIRLMDLGCAGGGAVKSVIDAGHEAIGLEGSDYSLIRKRAEWATIPDSLFTCDITRPFDILRTSHDGTAWHRATFDVITAWEVMEHLPADRLPVLCGNVREHLDAEGIWIMSVSTQYGEHHVTVKDRDWWLQLFSGEGFVNRPDLVKHFGDDWVRGPKQNAPESFHLVLSAGRP